MIKFSTLLKWSFHLFPPNFVRPVIILAPQTYFVAAAPLPLNLNHTLLKQGPGSADHLLPFGWYFFFSYSFWAAAAEGPLITKGDLPLCPTLWV